jgi:hypothetical protein
MERYSKLKMSVLLVYKLDGIPIKTVVHYFICVNKMMLTVVWKAKRPRIDNILLKNKDGVLTSLNFKNHYKATIVKTM